MPEGFVLNTEATNKLNAFDDQTTINQDGNKIIITVPKGSGKQHWNDGGIVGRYNIAMPENSTTLTADSPITIDQKLDDSGAHRKTFTGGKISEEFYGSKDKIPFGEMPMYGQTAYGNGWIMNNGKKQIVSYFGLTNDSIGSFNNYTGTVTIKFDPRLGVTEVKTPTISGNNNYKYLITYEDGSTSEGPVNNGEIITAAKDMSITQIAIGFNNLNLHEGTATDLPGNDFRYQKQDENKNAFEAYGSVDHTVDDGTELTSRIGFDGSLTLGGLTRFISTLKPGTNTQTVKDPAKLASNTRTFRWTAPGGNFRGKKKAGYMSVSSPGDQETPYVNEPIFYYVLPDGMTADSLSLASQQGNPTINKVNTDANGSIPARQVVKIDYTGTGYNYDASQSANNKVWLDNLPDIENGHHEGYIYVISPTTKLKNTKYNPADTSNFASTGTQFNSKWVEDRTDNLYYFGVVGFDIKLIGGANTASLAQGNLDSQLINDGTTDIYGTPQMHYAVRLINHSNDNLTHVETLINLPQSTDSGSSFTFQLNGKPTYDGDASDYTFLYSTKIGNLLSNNSAAGVKPDETGYFPADQVTDWSKIKSIIVKTNSLDANQRSSRLIFTGIDPNLVNDAGKKAYIKTGSYSDSTKPFINDHDDSGSIAIKVTATVNYAVHYKDANGQEHTVTIPGMSNSYDLSKNSTMVSRDDALKAAKDDKVKAKIPDGYELLTDKVILVSGGKTWQTKDEGGTPAFGGKVQYFYNGATIQLEAVPIVKTLTYRVIDENDPSNPQTIKDKIKLVDSNNHSFTGNQGSVISSDANNAYQSVKDGLESKGYVVDTTKSSEMPTSARVRASAKMQGAQLPQTGDETQASLGMLLLVMANIMALLGISPKRKH